MEEKEIDYVVADDLQAGDLIQVGGRFHTVTHTETVDDQVKVFTDEFIDYPVVYTWDHMVTLYGY
jgi:hypothetical protein